MKKARILFIEDDPYLGKIISDLLGEEGFEVAFFKTGESGLDHFIHHPGDLCLLDVMLPGISGFEVGKSIRKINNAVPILYLTAKSQHEDLVEGFKTGGDDYLKKPFSMEELVLRIKALLRRKEITGPDTTDKTFSFGKYRFKPIKRELLYDDEIHWLTHKESEMLRLMVERPNETVDRSLMLKTIWGDDSYFNARSMDVFLAKLRKHFKNDPDCKILNERSIGYKLIVAHHPPFYPEK